MNLVFFNFLYFPFVWEFFRMKEPFLLICLIFNCDPQNKTAVSSKSQQLTLLAGSILLYGRHFSAKVIFTRIQFLVNIFVFEFLYLSFIGNNLKLILVVVLYPFCPLLLILLTVSRTKDDNWIYGNYKHFFIASSASPPTTTYPVKDGKISFLFDYFNTVFDKMSSQTFSLIQDVFWT